jgi:hypothetical protein
VKIYSTAGIRAAKAVAILFFSVVTGCDIWNKPLTQPIIDQLSATYMIEVKRHPSYFLQGEPDPRLVSNEWKKDESYLEVIGTKGSLENWTIPLDKLTISDFDSEKPAREPQTIKVSYYDDYNGELSAEFQIVILETGAKLYKVYPDENNCIVPFPSLAEAGVGIEVFMYQPDGCFFKPNSLKYFPIEGGGEGIVIDRSANGNFAFKMPAYNIKLEAEFREIGSNEAFNINKNRLYTTLDSAVSDSGNGDAIIILKDGILISNGITIDGKSITLQPMDGAAKTVERATGYTSSIFTVKNGGNLTLDSAYSYGLVIDGNGIIAGKPLIEVDGGTLTMGADGNGVGTLVTLKDNRNTGNGGGVYVKNGVFTMNGGTISGNRSEDHGGGVYAGSGALVDIYGGLISGNEASYGGGIQSGEYSSGMFIKAIVNINGNLTVRNNTGSMGAGLNIDMADLTMLAGTVTNNTAVSWGGGVHINNGGTFSLKGGLIKDNTNNNTTTGSSGSDVYVETGNAAFIESGGSAGNVHY